MIRLLCVDVDGTLVGSTGVVPDEVWRAADEARARGVHLAICSGRPAFGGTRALAERLDPDGWHVFQNGASVVRLPTGETRSRPLSAETRAWLVARAHEAGRTLELYSDFAYVVSRDTDRARRHAQLLGISLNPRTDLALDGEPVRAQWLLPIDEMPAVLAEAPAGLTYSASTAPLMPDTGFVNVTPGGIDKAHAVAQIAAAYGIPLADVMMVGDGANDASTLRLVGHPVAMGNADPEARAAARHVVGHVDALGLVEAFALAASVA